MGAALPCALARHPLIEAENRAARKANEHKRIDCAAAYLAAPIPVPQSSSRTCTRSCSSGGKFKSRLYFAMWVIRSVSTTCWAPRHAATKPARPTPHPSSKTLVRSHQAMAAGGDGSASRYCDSTCADSQMLPPVHVPSSGRNLV